MADIDLNKITSNHFFIGFTGSLVALRFTPGLTYFERISNALSGSAVAGFVTPALVDWQHVTSPGLAGGFAFLLGLFGMSLSAAIFSAIRDLKLAETLTSWLKKGG